MKIMIVVGGHYIGIEPGEHTGALLQAVSTAKVYDRGWQSDAKYKPQDSGIELRFAEDCDFEEAPEPLKKLQERAAYSDTRWLEEYNKRTALEKEVADLKAKLGRAAEAVSE